MAAAIEEALDAASTIVRVPAAFFGAIVRETAPFVESRDRELRSDGSS
jgi:hypothetical protein